MPSPAKSKRSAGAESFRPLATLLSQALVAFTIEFDNEFEHRTPHRSTAKSGSPHDPWLLSLAMWALYLRFVPERGISVRDLLHAASVDKATLRQWLVRFTRWWGYLTVAPDLAASPVMPAPGDWIVRPTPGGLKAQQVWRRLFDVIEKRWRDRFGSETVGLLRQSLAAVVCDIEVHLPDYLPILGYGLRASLDRYSTPPREKLDAAALNLPALLSKVLLAFTIDFERESELSLAICANVLRVIDDAGVRVRDLPRLSGVSPEAIKMATGFLGKGGYVVVEAESPAGRTKVIRLTARGLLAQVAYGKRLSAVERNWNTRFSAERIRSLRRPLEQIVGDGTAERSPLFRGLEPYPEGWRASVARPGTLPHYPMVLHRGGYPDGS